MGFVFTPCGAAVRPRPGGVRWGLEGKWVQGAGNTIYKYLSEPHMAASWRRLTEELAYFSEAIEGLEK